MDRIAGWEKGEGEGGKGLMKMSEVHMLMPQKRKER
jgi:hypothetical protein